MSHAPRYTHGHEAATLASHGTRTAASSCAYLLPELRSGMSLLDVGCGPGTVTLDLAEHVAPGRVVGVDAVEAPLVAARAAAQERGDTSISFEVADVARLPYDDGSFDVVHAHQVLQHLVDPVAALREMARVVRPGGVLAVRDADYAAMAWYPASEGLEEWRRLYRAVARSNSAEPDAGRHLRAWVRAAGLPEPRLSASTWLYADPESCRWWGSSQATRFTSPVFAEQAERLEWLGADAEAIASVGRAWRSWGEHPDAWFTVVHGEALVRL